MRTPNRCAKARNVAPRNPRFSTDGDEVVAGKQKRERIKDLHKECFVPLTEEEERQIVHAFENCNRQKVLVSYENSNICTTGEELQCLMPEGWLNDVKISGGRGYRYKDVQGWTRPEKLGYNLLGCDKVKFRELYC